MTVTQDSSSSEAIVAKVTRTINRPISEVFKYIVPVDIPHIFLVKDLYPALLPIR